MQLAARISMGVALVALGTALAATPPRPDRRAAWFAGIPVELTLNAEKSRAVSAPLPASPRMYVTAPTFAEATFAAATIEIDGQRRVVPAHDLVIDQFVSQNAATPALTFFVVPGAKATPDTVRFVEGPSDSLPGRPLVREIFVGTDWVRLTSHVIIEYGVAMGWLALAPYALNSSIATRYLDQPAGFAVNVSIEGRR